MSGGLLDAVVAAARRTARERERSAAGRRVDQAAAARQPDGAAFEAALAGEGFRVIAECKRRSPSKGVLRCDYDPADVARGYAEAGAAAISVLTEPTFFDGSLDHLRAVRDAVTLPLLRKDFIVTEFQILEARAAGADAVLLIAAALDQPAILRLLACSSMLGLAALVEVHDRGEAAMAVDAGARVIGVNSRNLQTLDVSGAVFDVVADAIPDDVVAVAESGLRSAADLVRVSRLGYDAFLIGERLMTAADPSAALRGLLDEARTLGAA